MGCGCGKKYPPNVERMIRQGVIKKKGKENPEKELEKKLREQSKEDKNEKE